MYKTFSSCFIILTNMFFERANNSSNHFQCFASRDGDLVKWTFPVEHNCGHFEPFLVSRLVSLRWTVQFVEQAARWRCGQNGHAGNLVVFVNVEKFVWIGVTDFNLHQGTFNQLDNLWLNYHEVHIILTRPLCNPIQRRL